MGDIVKIWTDGGCVPNPGKGGWGALLEFNGTRKLIGGFSDEENTTNNRMEILAAIEALRCLKRPCEVILVSDSQYMIGIASGKNKAHSNQDLVSELHFAASPHKIDWQWVREFTMPEQSIVHERAEAEVRKVLA